MRKQKIIKFIKNNFFLFGLIAVGLIFLAINIRINVFKYNNFDYGKFDLGNMTQMVWNVSRGNGLWLTDYFGTNLPRWAMSHVDPILYLFVPIFMVFQSPLTLVISQLTLVVFSSILVFLIARLHFKNDLISFLLGFAFLFNPSIGYLTATSGFHGVTAAIPFFLGAFYIFEHMHQKDKFNTKNLTIFAILCVITMSGKEQIPLYTFMFGIFIILFRNKKADSLKELLKTKPGKIGLSLSIVSLVWFITAFFIIIPANAHYRIEGYERFVQNIQLNDSRARDVALPNYFLNRYAEFGDSYLEILFNMILNPRRSVSVFFAGDKVENFTRTFEPWAFLPFAFPGVLMMAVPDLIINFMTTAGGIGTAEITNHRISMIIPVLAVATVLAIKYLVSFFVSEKNKKTSAVFLSSVVVLFALYTSNYYNSPVYLWIKDALKTKVISQVFAKQDVNLVKQDLEVGDVVKLSELENKDIECAHNVVKMIPDGASVSGPDSLGGHLSMRETYAIFPALYNEADYTIVDVFSRKIVTILDVEASLTADIIENLIKNPKYKMELGCGNFFVFKNVGSYEKEALLPIQERFEYDGKFKYEFFQGVEVVDFEIPSALKRGEDAKLDIVYFRSGSGSKEDTDLNDYTLFTSFVNEDTGEIYQLANLPSFALRSPGGWVKNRYYLEEIDMVIPNFIEPGNYHVFVGMGNKIRTRSMYLATVEVR